MKDLFKVLQAKKISLPDEVHILLNSCKKYTVFESVQELADAAVGGADNLKYEVKYDIPYIFRSIPTHF